MRIEEIRPGAAVCEGRGERRLVDTLLVGEQTPGTWVLVFLNSAREVLHEQRVGEINAALDALEAALRGEPVEAFCQDLFDREPVLPEFLRSQLGAKA